jgi:hypothetical protein
MVYKSINFTEKFGRFSEQLQPKVIAEMNDYQFKIGKLRGDFICIITKILTRLSSKSTGQAATQRDRQTNDRSRFVSWVRQPTPFQRIVFGVLSASIDRNPTNARIRSAIRRAISAGGFRLLFDETGAPAGIVLQGLASTRVYAVVRR